MPESEPAGGIEIDQDLKFQSRSWKVQRTGWVIMLLVVIAAVLGIFGNGPLSNASAGAGDSFRIDYQRFVRLHAPETIAINVEPSPSGDSTIALWLDRPWLRAHSVKAIVPEPRESSVTSDRVIYRFAIGGSPRLSRIEFELETTGYGRLKGRAGIVGGPEVSFRQFSYF